MRNLQWTHLDVGGVPGSLEGDIDSSTEGEGGVGVQVRDVVNAEMGARVMASPSHLFDSRSDVTQHLHMRIQSSSNKEVLLEESWSALSKARARWPRRPGWTDSMVVQWRDSTIGGDSLDGMWGRRQQVCTGKMAVAVAAPQQLECEGGAKQLKLRLMLGYLD